MVAKPSREVEHSGPGAVSVLQTETKIKQNENSLVMQTSLDPVQIGDLICNLYHTKNVRFYTPNYNQKHIDIYRHVHTACFTRVFIGL